MRERMFSLVTVIRGCAPPGLERGITHSVFRVYPAIGDPSDPWLARGSVESSRESTLNYSVEQKRPRMETPLRGRYILLVQYYVKNRWSTCEINYWNQIVPIFMKKKQKLALCILISRKIQARMWALLKQIHYLSNIIFYDVFLSQFSRRHSCGGALHTHTRLLRKAYLPRA